jgi:predicted site-specific integrase-resolvase
LTFQVVVTANGPKTVALIGYARASTREEGQVLDRQLDALKAAGCGQAFEDGGSGASSDRPGLTSCLDYLRHGDVLIVLDLDRLGRPAGDLVRLLDELAPASGCTTLLLTQRLQPGVSSCKSRQRLPRWNAN